MADCTKMNVKGNKLGGTWVDGNSIKPMTYFVLAVSNLPVLLLQFNSTSRVFPSIHSAHVICIIDWRPMVLFLQTLEIAVACDLLR
jgi:hypothetical protein